MKLNLSDVSYEILVVDDGSTDGMADLLDDAANKQPFLSVVHHPLNMGRGRGVRTAMKHAKGDYLILLDADLSYSPEHIPALLRPLENGQADITLASPYNPEGRVENVPFTRALMSRLGNKVLSNSFSSKLYTATCIVRGYTREVFETLELFNDGKSLHLELLYKAELMGFRLLDVPAKLIWRDRKRGESKKKGFGWFLDIPIFKMRRVILNHFVFNFVAKPKFLYLGPTIIGILIFFYGAFSLTLAMIENILTGVENPLRQTLIDGELTLLLTSLSLILTTLFIFLFFSATQAKQYFEEQYVLSCRNNYMLKQLHAKLKEKDSR